MNLPKIFANNTKYIVYGGRVVPAKIRITPNGRKLAYLKNGNSWNDYGIKVFRIFNEELSAYLHLQDTQKAVIKGYEKRLAKTKSKIADLEKNK